MSNDVSCSERQAVLGLCTDFLGTCITVWAHGTVVSGSVFSPHWGDHQVEGLVDVTALHGKPTLSKISVTGPIIISVKDKLKGKIWPSSVPV